LVESIDEGRGLIYYCEMCYKNYENYDEAFLCEKECKRKKSRGNKQWQTK